MPFFRRIYSTVAKKHTEPINIVNTTTKIGMSTSNIVENPLPPVCSG